MLLAALEALSLMAPGACRIPHAWRRLVAPALREQRPGAKEIRRELAALGVSTEGIFERQELDELLERSRSAATPSGAAAGSSAGGAAPSEPSLDSMHVQEVMAELEARGEGYDVMKSEAALRRQLRLLRAQQLYDNVPFFYYESAAPPASPASATAAPASSASTPPPSTSQSPTSAAPAASTAPAASAAPASEARKEAAADGAPSGPVAPQADGRGIGRPTGSPVLFTEAFASIAERASGVLSDARGAATNATMPAAPLRIGRELLQSVQPGGLLQKPSTKIALLAVCACMLRFGVLRTIIAALAAALAYDLLVSTGRGIQQRLRPKRDAAA